MYLVYDSSHKEAAVIAAQAADSEQCLRLVDVAGHDSHQRHAVTARILDSSLQLAARPSCQRAAAKTYLAEMLVECPCWFCTPDGVAGPLQVEQDGVAMDVGLLLREAAYHRCLTRLPPEELHAGLESLTLPAVEDLASLCGEAAVRLELHGAVVLSGFLGTARALQLSDTDFGAPTPACPCGAPSPGSGRGDWAVLPSEAPEDLLSQLDAFVSRLRPLTHGKLDTCEFRTWPMVTVYEPGMRYTWHLDNGNSTNGRVLTCVYYLNEDWPLDSGGELRLLRQHGGPETLEILAEVPPTFDTLVVFWSQSVPHEVLPPWSRLRHAISVWYLCPCCGAEHFLAGNAEPAFGQSATSAVEGIWASLEAGAFAPFRRSDNALEQLGELARCLPHIKPQNHSTLLLLCSYCYYHDYAAPAAAAAATQAE